MTEAVGPFAASLIDASRRAWAGDCAWRLGETRPELSSAAGVSGSEGWRSHFDGLLQHLSAALEFDAPELFGQQAVWLRTSFEARGVDAKLLLSSLTCLRDELRERLPASVASHVAKQIDAAIADVTKPIATRPSALLGDDPESELAREYLLAALEGRQADAIGALLSAIDAGLSASQVANGVLGRVQTELGAMWQRSELSVAEEHLVSRTTEEALRRVHGRLTRLPPNGKRILITCVDGDLHDIGLRVVADHFELAGWTAVYLGASMPALDAASVAAEFDVDLVAIGAKLATHLCATAELLAVLRSDVRTSETPVIVGGRPFELAPELWKTLGADGCARNASEAVALGERLTNRG